MAWTITNRQLDPMIFTLTGGASVTVNGGASAVVAVAVEMITYHALAYHLNGLWPFPDGQALNATYGGGNNCYIQNPTTGTNAVYAH